MELRALLMSRGPAGEQVLQVGRFPEKPARKEKHPVAVINRTGCGKFQRGGEARTSHECVRWHGGRPDGNRQAAGGGRMGVGMGICESEVGMKLGEPGGRRGEVICMTS